MEVVRISKSECVLAVNDINIDEWNVKFSYRKNSENETDISPKLKENLQMMTIGNNVYFHVIGQFQTDYEYKFKMSLESLSGATSRDYYKKVLSRRGDC